MKGTSPIINQYIQVRICFSFHEDVKKICLLLTNFWLFEAEIKVSMKKFGKTSTAFEFSTLKSGYIPIFIKIWEKSLLADC